MTRRKPLRSDTSHPATPADLHERLMRIIKKAPITIDNDPVEAARLKAELLKERTALKKRG